MRLVALVVLGLAGCFDGGTECADGFTCPAGTRCANPPTGDVHCVAVTCGNGILDEAEACDGDALGDGQCLDFGYDEGALRCDVNCTYDVRECQTLGFSTVYAGDDRIGQFCAYETPAGVVANVQQRLEILRIEDGEKTATLPLVPEAPTAIACVPGVVAILSENGRLFAHANSAWSQGPAPAGYAWSALTVDNGTKVVALSTSTSGSDSNIYTHASASWVIDTPFVAPYDKLDVRSGYGVAVSNEDDIMTVRASPSATWSAGPRAAPPNVQHVWGLDDTRQFLSNGMTVLRPIGAIWAPIPFITSGPIVGRSYDDVFVLGTNSRLQYFDGMTWSTTAGGFDDAWVASTNTLYASRGSDLLQADALWFTMVQSAEQIQITGSTLLRLDTFRRLLFVNEVSNVAPNARAFAASTNMIFLVGPSSPTQSRGQRILISPLNYAGDQTFTSPPLEAVVAVSDTEAFAVGERGAFATFRANNWTPESIASVDLHGIVHKAGELIVVGDAGTILTSTDGTPPRTPVDSGTTANLRAVWTDGTNVVAVGDAGTILRRGSDGVWTAMQSRTARDLTAVHGTSTSDLVAVGKDVILRYDGVAWSALRPPEPNAQLTSVFVTPRHLYVGSTAAGYVLRRRF